MIHSASCFCCAASVNAVMGVRQPLFVTLRTGTLALPRGSNDSAVGGESSVGLMLLSGYPSVSRAESVSSTSSGSSLSGSTESGPRPNTVDMVSLVQLPCAGSSTPSKDANTFEPGSLICSRRCLFLRPPSSSAKVRLCVCVASSIANICFLMLFSCFSR
ncbi:unnamed protein product [Dibothriocephalus latus]|uniref:Uncharacterized protein n=1 Tax=Dibothriocephalus latus TaxID=60516 RepID=A0A3P6R8K5_DIBLA|nr:unnamed protein product [Dibothriocephalus latus]